MARKKRKTRKAKKRKSRKSSASGWSAAKLSAYKRAKRKLINHFKKAGNKGSLKLGL